MKAGREAVTVGRYPLAPDQITLRNYQSRLAFDEEIRNFDHRYAQMDIDDVQARRLRDGFSGALSDDDLQELVGSRIERFRRLGNTEVERGSVEWRNLARAMCLGI